MFHNLYKKQTMFTKQTINNKLEGELPGFDDTVTFQIPRKGDLISTIFIRMVLRKSPTKYIVPIQSFGYEVFEYMELLIGDKIIDRMTGLEMRLLMKTSSSKNDVNALSVMCGDFVHDTSAQELGDVWNDDPVTTGDQYDVEYRYFYVPIPFYFFRNSSLAVPLCALTRQEVSIRFKLKPYQACVSMAFGPRNVINDPRNIENYPINESANDTLYTLNDYYDPLFSITDFTVPVEYVYVSPEECRYFQETPLNYTITQTQRTVMSNYDTKKQLLFINPIKEILMYPTITRCLSLSETNSVYKNRYILFNQFRFINESALFLRITDSAGIIRSADLTFDDKTYVSHSIANYKFLKNYQNLLSRGRFSYDKQPMTTHEDIVGLSFAFEPTNYMDTGYINFNGFKNVTLELTLKDRPYDYFPNQDITVFVIARSLNILVIKDGVCDIVFKNSII